MRASWPGPYFNTVTHPHAGTACHLHRSETVWTARPVQDTLPAHPRAFAPEWQCSAEEADKKTLLYQEQYYNQHARALPEIQVGTNVALQNPTTKLWDIYGIVVGIGPHRRYYVKTTSGRVLTRNRRFLRRRVPMTPVESTPSGLANPRPANTPQDLLIPPRRSHRRRRRRPNRLIEDTAFM